MKSIGEYSTRQYMVYHSFDHALYSSHFVGHSPRPSAGPSLKEFPLWLAKLLLTSWRLKGGEEQFSGLTRQMTLPQRSSVARKSTAGLTLVQHEPESNGKP